MIPLLARWLVDEPSAPGDDFTRVRQSLDGGLPVEWPLGIDGMPGLTLGVVIPAGDAMFFRDADSGEVIADSAPELASDNEDRPELLRPLLLLRSGINTIAATRLTALRPWIVPNPGGLWSGVLSIVPVAWRVHAGAMVKPGRYGSFVDLALRFVTGASDVAPDGVVTSNGGFG